MNASATHASRFVEIDALRGIAALGVLLFHFTGHYGRLYGHQPHLSFSFETGNYGVHLFFVISGFVIFMTLERTPRAIDFIVSRFSRLFPAYWAAMALTLVAVEFAGLRGQEISARDAWINLSMLSDLFDADLVDGSYWTLQIELLFYVQMLGWFTIGGLRHIRLIICGWLLLAAAYGIAARNGDPLPYVVREVLILRFIPLFAAGILLFRIRHARDRLWQNLVLLALCVGCSWLLWSWEIAIVLTICAAIFGLLFAGHLRFLSAPVMLFCGGISYTVYLVHQNIGYIAIAHLERAGVPPLVSVFVALATSVLLSWILSLTVERPALLMIRSAYARWRSKVRT